MKNVNFTDEEIQTTLDATVAILMLGNVEFGMVTDTQPGPSSESKQLLEQAAKLLGVEVLSLVKAMTTKK
jgi:myosin heavy subunit